MSKTKHTPGPWYVGAQNDALYIIDKTPRPDNDYPQHDAEVAAIAKVYHSGEPGVEEANAHLIAAAPDLYEALSDLFQAEYDDAPLTAELGQKCLAALKKARGEPS